MSDTSCPIDLMSISHLVWYMILGIFVKEQYMLAIILSILWEIGEYYVVNHPTTRRLLKLYWPIPQKYWDERHRLNPVFDILFNMVGYYMGNKIVLDKLY